MGLKLPVLNINYVVLAVLYAHAFSRSGEVFFPAAEVPESEAFKAQLQSPLISYQHPHLLFTCFCSFQVRVAVGCTYTSPYTNGFNDVIGRERIATGTRRSPGFIGGLGIIEKYLRISDVRFIVSLVVDR